MITAPSRHVELRLQLADEREKTRQGEEMSKNWLAERDTLKDSISDLLFKTDTMETDLAAKTNQIQTLVRIITN